MDVRRRRRIGIVGYGHLGRFLSSVIIAHPELELAFVWNRTLNETLKKKIPEDLILEHLEDCGNKKPDLIVEVAHPSISEKYGKFFLETSDYLIGSPTALADPSVENDLKEASEAGHGLYVPSGALWGGEDIRKMADRGSLKGLCITMRKHPSCFKLNGDLKAKNEAVINGEEAVTLYEGSVRDLCPLAPNNVNTMAAAAVAAHNLGFDRVKARLVSDPKLNDWHYVEIEVIGPTTKNGNVFKVETIRKNPADPGVVTGSATYASFLSSILRAKGKGPGIHLC